MECSWEFMVCGIFFFLFSHNTYFYAICVSMQPLHTNSMRGMAWKCSRQRRADRKTRQTEKDLSIRKKRNSKRFFLSIREFGAISFDGRMWHVQRVPNMKPSTQSNENDSLNTPLRMPSCVHYSFLWSFLVRLMKWWTGKMSKKKKKKKMNV